ncbi:unnamed protein product, partial [Meganyctiphanes norvegica]
MCRLPTTLISNCSISLHKAAIHHHHNHHQLLSSSKADIHYHQLDSSSSSSSSSSSKADIHCHQLGNSSNKLWDNNSPYMNTFSMLKLPTKCNSCRVCHHKKVNNLRQAKIRF